MNLLMGYENGTLELRAIAFAEQAHFGQTRKYTFEPYIKHPAAVAGIVREYFVSEDVLAAAWLHDVVEDCGVELMELEMKFGERVAELVYWLTNEKDPSKGNRATRKALDRERLAQAPGAAKAVKLADIIHNTPSIIEHDPEFARVYLAEVRQLLPLLKVGDSLNPLWERANGLVTLGESRVG